MTETTETVGELAKKGKRHAQSKEVVGDLSDKVIVDTVSIVTKSVKTLLSNADDFTDAVSKSLLVRNVLTTEYMDLEHQPLIINFFFNMLVRNQDFTNLMCLTYHNLSGQVPADWWATNKYYNMTTIMLSVNPTATRPFTDYGSLFVDYRSPGTWKYFMDYNNPGYMRPGTVPFQQENVTTLSLQPAYQHLMSANPTNVTQYNTTVYNGLSGLLATRNVWIPGRDLPAYMCASSSYLSNLESFLINSKPTPNSVLFVYELRLQRLIGVAAANATVNATAVSTKTGYPRYSPLDTPHAPTAAVAQAVAGLYGGLGQVPYNNGTVVMTSAEVNGEEWFINTVYLVVPPQDWVLVIAMPRKDFFAQIDKAQKAAIIVAIVCAMMGAITVTLATLGALRPLHQLADSMQQLTKFDFSSLEGGVLDNRSIIREIRHVQDTFSAMVNAFSVSIKKNRALMGAANGTATSTNKSTISK
ncbi:hypothetical protein HK104_001380 [Borealophlyctis nickersoniae]|nr:hypothetical protein HK104_001380 [Borealophlyctis nickersoniae]